VKRYPIEPLCVAMCMTPNTAMIRLGVSGSTQQKYREEGVNDKTAELLALRAGFHPFEIWPELAEDRLAAMHVKCEDCGAEFLPTRKGHRFCSNRCNQRKWQRDYQRRRRQTPGFNEAEAARQKALRASMSERAQRRELDRLHAWTEANRDRYNAHRRMKKAS
jgi:hypothetical protein